MPWPGHDPRDPGVASETSARVADVLERAEAYAREIREQAERSADETRRTARHEADGIAAEARRAAEAAARDRVLRISELRASIAARSRSLVEGLEGGELTAARLNELVAALGGAADRVLVEVGLEPEGSDGPATPARAPSEAAAEPSTPPPITDPIPLGAPMARRPRRSSSARFTAVMMAIQGSGRDEVADHLAQEHGLEDATELLDEVFGRVDAPA